MEQEHAVGGENPTGDAVIQGIVERLRDEAEGERRRVVRFVVRSPDDALQAVEMRGEELRGVLDAGDHVAIPLSARSSDGTFRPSALHNASTGSDVVMWTPPLSRRLLRAVGLGDAWRAAMSSVIGAAVGLASSAVALQADPQAGPGPEREAGAESAPVIALALLALVLVLLMLWRWRRGRWSPELLGLSLGLAAAAAIAAMAF